MIHCHRQSAVCRAWLFLCVAIALIFGQSRTAAAYSILDNYQITSSLTSANTSATVSYNAPLSAGGEGCNPVRSTGTEACSAVLSVQSRAPFRLGIQKVVKPTGFFYYDIGFGGAFYQLEKKHLDANTPKQPLESASVNIIGVTGSAILRFGITPAKFPDVFASVGLGGSLNWLDSRINGEHVYVALGRGNGQHLGLELVYYHFKGGGAIGSAYTYYQGSLSIRPIGILTNISVAARTNSVDLIKVAFSPF